MSRPQAGLTRAANAPELALEREALLGLLADARRVRRALADALRTAGEKDRVHATISRLNASVIRPLAEAVGPATGPEPTGDRDDADLNELTVRATTLRGSAAGPPELLEATSALQDLACRADSSGDPDAMGRLVTELRELQRDVPAAVRVQANGPLLVTNVENLHDWLGQPIPTTPQMALCRCGGSAMKPFCDGTHATNGFTDTKDPNRVADRRDTWVGQQLTVLDNRGTCQHSAFCTDRLATVFRLGEEPFVAPSGGRMDEIVRAVRDCPSGALSYAIDRVEARDAVGYHDCREPTIEVSKDGPYRVTGGIALEDAEGRDVGRNEGASREHYTLCRCGQAQNKPFCTGMHWHVEFTDPVSDPKRTPTMFEWAGGLPALTRMTRLFYEKHVPNDPMLGPIFANMSADHPQRVAKWLGEVFGGPPCYSEQYGGYPRMLSQHVGKCLTEEWRSRWVSLLLQSALEAGLPNDAEFRSAFQAYIEWGSRLAVENSQTNAQPPEHMPMPHWDWTTAAGPPTGRISALAPRAEEDEPVVVLPADDEPVRFEKHIKPLFRSRDRQSMTFAFDLWSYDDVNQHADAILKRLTNGTMPCDGAWPAEKIDVFQRWDTSGRLA